MTDYTVITVPGIGEASSVTGETVGMLKYLTDELESRFTSIHFNWRNAYGPVPSWNGPAYEVNVEQAKVELRDLVSRQTDPVVLAGYSGGADVASQVAAELSLPLIAVANPRRAAGDSAAPYFGIIEERADNANDIYDLANPADVICCCPPDPFPLRDFYELTKNFALSEPLEWGRQLLLGVQQRAFAPASVFNLGAWQLALQYTLGYLDGSQHVDWYPPMIPALAASVNAGLT